LSNLAVGAERQAFVQVLASSARNVGIDTWEANARTVTPDCSVAWSFASSIAWRQQEGLT